MSAGVTESRTRTAAGWALLTGTGYQLSQVLVAVTLAAILGPDRFGVVALATIYVTFVDFIVRQGIIVALVQRKDLDDDHLHAGFWMSTGTAVVLAVVTIAISGWWSGVNNAPELRPLLVALSGMGILQAAWQVPRAIKQRELDFKGSELPINIGAIAGAVVGMAGAFLGAEEWSIVMQMYTFGVVGNLLLYRATDWRPRFRFSGRAARDLFAVSSGAFLSTIGSFVSGFSDALVLGIMFGPLAVGLYRFGARFVTLIINVTQASLSRVLLAVLSRSQDDIDEFGRTLRRQLGTLSLAVLPSLAILFAVGRAAPLLLGDQWEPTGPVLRILCLVGLARGLVLFTNPILMSRGLAHRAAATLWFSGAVHLVAVLVAGFALRDSSVVDQITGMAAARLIVQVLVVTPLMLAVTSRYSHVPVRGLLSAMAPPMAAAAAAMVVGTALDEVARRGDFNPWVTVILVGVAASGAAIAVLLAVSGPARRLVSDARRRVRGSGPGPM
jgi:PST family polysaccharide transporter